MSELQALLAELGAKADALAPYAKAGAEATPAAVEEAPVAKSEAAEAVEEKAAEAAPEAAAEEAADAGAEEGDVAKSFEVTDSDGNKLQAIDGYALLKALEADVADLKAAIAAAAEAKVEPEAVAKSFTDAKAATDEQASILAKSLGAALDKLAASDAALLEARERAEALEARVAAQDEVVKSLSEAVEKIGAQGAGRRSAVTVQERPSVVAKGEDRMTIGQIFAKATELNRAGRLNSFDVSRITASANSGQGVPAEYQPLFAG